jgi:hypothetical protein
MTHRLEGHLLYAGVYDGHLNVYDTRMSNGNNVHSTVHIEQVTRRGYIHALEVQDDYVLVMHKSSTLCLYDRRTWQKIENVPVRRHVTSIQLTVDMCVYTLLSSVDTNVNENCFQ